MKLLSARTFVLLSLATALVGGMAAISQRTTQPELAVAPIAPIEQHSGQQPELARLARLEAELTALSASSPATGTGESEARLNSLRAEMIELRKMLERIAAGHGSSSGSQTGRDIVDPAQELREEQEHTQRIVGFLDQAFARAGSDTSWASTASAAISGTLSNPALQRTQLGDVRCQATLCRIEATHAASDAEQSFVLNLVQLEDFRDADAFLQRVERDDGTVATTIFVSRTGYRLPSPG